MSSFHDAVMMSRRKYYYVGPPEIREAARKQPSGIPIRSVSDIETWLKSDPTERRNDESWVATFTINTDEVLRLAQRRSEHVACASGGPVLAAGEITIDGNIDVIEISNQSTGFCPGPESWNSVETVLNQLGVEHPGRFTNEIIFRRCPKCNERNIVKDAWYYCLICNSVLPEKWNFADDES